ncbi:ankyrin repeat domain-containing protein 34B-like, partial [Penaeus monodon]|uniref:ankyrin repeat domain-containing protein 34B-like n=1 Tax=Penaeus monodon TaxID=6687 RepID=UPI0018A7B123
SIDLQDNTGQAALHKASLYGFSGLVRTFIDAGAEVDLQDRVGRTALIWACRRGQNTVIKDLLEAGADPNIRDKTGRDALSWATRYKKNDSAELLLKYCPDLRLQESQACGSRKVPRRPTNTSSTSPSPSAPPTPQDASATRASPSAAIIRDSEYTLKIPRTRHHSLRRRWGRQPRQQTPNSSRRRPLLRPVRIQTRRIILTALEFVGLRWPVRRGSSRLRAFCFCAWLLCVLGRHRECEVIIGEIDACMSYY